LNKKLIWISIAVIIMAAIFIFSSQPDYKSNAMSMKVTDKIVDILTEQQTNSTNIVKWNQYVRKYAHFTLFLLLGIAVFNAFRYQWVNKKQINLWILSILFCLLYAVSDEVHQIFVPGRGCLLRDVMIDLSGSIVGCLGMLAILFAFKKKSNQAKIIKERE